jgi:phosphate starvation-inducible PhoH-like protein
MISAKTQNQTNYIYSIIESEITLCSGPSGTGKDFIPLGLALEWISRDDKPAKKLIVTKPMIASSYRDFPWLKGDLNEKCKPYFQPVMQNLELIIKNKKDLELMIKRETISFIPLELMRGFSFHDSFVVFSEMQNSTIEQAIMAITRLGENCKMIFNGDTDQKDVDYEDGLNFLMEKLKGFDNLASCVNLTYKDIQRNPKIAKILKVLNK